MLKKIKVRDLVMLFLGIFICAAGVWSFKEKPPELDSTQNRLLSDVIVSGSSSYTGMWERDFTLSIQEKENGPEKKYNVSEEIHDKVMNRLMKHEYIIHCIVNNDRMIAVTFPEEADK
ncbi:hypothetical protein CEF21_05070 [Bacillus sp. FJAT-42376]|uniref:hypothetical protein n=1 Tax=Bacillus sp. FJAT-42376 TaxID=2014076 RepID=UPI000F4E0A6F|nr:hypothetical protein [Bacillus sp. FJAT-42376]AZB41721.1 hypothetical protein CEF21_05070 [Bacillus sp. FJAT-42376]